MNKNDPPDIQKIFISSMTSVLLGQLDQMWIKCLLYFYIDAFFKVYYL